MAEKAISDTIALPRANLPTQIHSRICSATICAISKNGGAVFLCHSHPAPHARSRCKTDTLSQSLGACRNQFLARVHDSSADAAFLSQKHQPSARAAAKRVLPRAWRFYERGCPRDDLARIVVHIPIPPQIARIVKGHRRVHRLGAGNRSAWRARNSVWCSIVASSGARSSPLFGRN